MATSTLPNSPPEEANNPGQHEYEALTKRFEDPGDTESRPAGNPTDPRSNDVAAGNSSDPRGEPSAEDLATAEENPDTPISHENQVGRGYRRPIQNKQGGMFNWSGYSRRKKWGISLGGGFIGGGIIAIMIFLFPALRLEGYLAGINQRVFAAANNAVSKRVDNLFERYMITKVLAMKRCGTKVTGDCRLDYSQYGFAKDLFLSWQDVRVEQKLFDQYGLEIRSYKNPSDGKERFKIIDKAGRFGNPGDELTVKDGKLALGKFEGGPRIFGKEWGKFIKNETRWDQVLQRRSVRKYLVRKHGVKFWCFFACSTKDSIDNAKVSATTKLKYKLIERTVYPFSQKYGLIMKCLTGADASMCDPNNLEKAGIDRSLLSDQDLKDLEAVANGEKTTLSQILMEKLLTKIGMDEVSARSVASLVPVAGQIYLGLSAIDTLETVKHMIESGALSKIAANVNSDQYVEYYTAMRSANDEALAGKLSAAEAGALVSQFNDGNRPAEQSLVYQTYNDPGKVNVSLLGGTAYAASSAPTQTPPYVCSNGQPIPAGMLVCPEKTLNKRTFKVEHYFNDAKGVINAVDVYDNCIGVTVLGKCVGIVPRSVIHPALQGVNWVINSTLGALLGEAMKAMQIIPGIGDFLNLATSWATKFFDAFFNQVFPLPLHADSPGREKYDALEAGGEITASEFNQGGYTDSGQAYGLGGQQLSDQQYGNATQAYLDQQNYDNSHGSILERVAGKDNPSSLLTRFAMAIPTSWSQLSSGVIGVLTSPFHNLGAIWQPAYAAADTASINAFGVPRFGYTANDPAFTADPSIYTQQYCDQLNKTWQASKTQDPVTGIDQYSTTNPCLLEQVAVEAASSVYTNNDSLDSSNNPSPTTDGSVGSSGWAWPTTVNGAVITSCFGQRHGAAGGGYHPGTDIAQAEGTPVYAAQAGKVTFVGPASGYGNNFVIIEVSPTVHESYGHMDSATVKVGDTVAAGQQIGTVGNQGASTGPHLHLNLSIGASADPYNGNASVYEHGLAIPSGVSDPYDCASYHYPGSP